MKQMWTYKFMTFYVKSEVFRRRCDWNLDCYNEKFS